MEARMQIRRVTSGVLSVSVLAVCGCTFTSDGLELRLSNETPPSDISIEWHSVNGDGGIMSATTSDGRAYQGAYLKITQHARNDQMAFLWEGWDASRGWRSWSSETAPDFVKTYDGKVLANLRAESGDRMRCRFVLESRSRGMNGGGAGKCQVPGGKTFDAVFPSATSVPQREVRGARNQYVAAWPEAR
jgi:hypothetical protein